jgi:hypothetical protein
LGISTVRGIADELNRRGIPAPRGGQWSHTQVFRLFAKSPSKYDSARAGNLDGPEPIHALRKRPARSRGPST